MTLTHLNLNAAVFVISLHFYYVPPPTIRSSMISRMEAITNFVIVTRTAMGPTHEKSVKTVQDQRDHALQVIRLSNLDIVGTTDLIKFIQSDTFANAFGPDSVAEFVEATLGNPTATTDGFCKGRPTSQVHYYFCNYLTDGDWASLRKSDHTGMLYIMQRRAHAIGLVYPSELTVSSIVSIVKVVDAAGGSREDTAEETHKLIVEYKRINKLKRHGVPKTLDTFPEATSEFTAKYPGTYSVDNGPVPCPYDVLDVDRAKSTTAARKSHKSLQPTSSSELVAGKGSSLSHLQQLTSALMQHVMRNSRGQADPGPSNLLIYGSPPPARKQQLALRDGSSSYGGNTDELDGGIISPDSASVGEASPALSVKAPLGATKAPGVSNPAAVGAAIAAVQTAMAEMAAKAMATAKKSAKASAAAIVTAHKRPAAAPDEAAGKCSKPSISDIKCRSCVTARTGLPGLGMTRSIKYEDDSTDAKAEAAEWLRTRCEELGVECDY